MVDKPDELVVEYMLGALLNSSEYEFEEIQGCDYQEYAEHYCEKFFRPYFTRIVERIKEEI